MMHADAGLNSTADDMARWMVSVLDGTQLSSTSREQMWTTVLLNDGKPSSFAIGWGIDQRAGYRSAGMSGGARSAFSLFPRYGVGVVILTNLLGANPEELTDELASALVPQIRLTGVLKLRADAELSEFSNLPELLAAAVVQKASDQFDEGELEDWIRDLLFSGSLLRALQLARFDPRSIRPAIRHGSFWGTLMSQTAKRRTQSALMRSLENEILPTPRRSPF